MWKNTTDIGKYNKYRARPIISEKLEDTMDLFPQIPPIHRDYFLITTFQQLSHKIKN